MRFDIALAHLANRFFYRLADFFIHWYLHSWQIIYSLRQLNKPAFFIAVPFYLLWALIPVYLIVRIFFIELL